MSRWLVAFSAADLAPEAIDVLASQGVPAGAASPRTLALLATATELFRRLHRPAAVIEEVTLPDLARTWANEHQDWPSMPLVEIAPSARHLALFALTLGDALSAAISQLFAKNELALASMLDGVASAAASTAVERLEQQYHRRLPEEDQGACVLAYSPGYCGWDISGQRELFRLLRPEEIGITLNASCLMSPLKSVSGVLVAAAMESHRFETRYPCCAECTDRSCRHRIARLSG